MTPAARIIWTLICFDLLLMQRDIKHAQRHTTGTGHNK